MTEKASETEEKKHIIEILEATKKAIKDNNILKLKELSNQTIHSSCIFQHRGFILIAVLIYTISKLIERREGYEIENWNKFIKNFDSNLDAAIKSLKKDDFDQYGRDLEIARKTIESISKEFKENIKEVLRKAQINKASRIYEHGISLEQTAKLLGITQWELSEYAGKTGIPDVKYAITLNVKKRAKMALEFFE